MPKKPSSLAHAAALRRRAEAELKEFGDKRRRRPLMHKLYRKAKARLRKQRSQPSAPPAAATADVNSQRLLHELQVHQVELEMQNAELHEARDRMEVLLEKYTDFYDFAPVGYLSLNDAGQILEVNLTGAALLGTGRAQLINRRLSPFIAPASRAVFGSFLEQIFAGVKRQICEVQLLRADGSAFWVDFHGTAAISASSPQKWCRVVVSDITALKRAEEAQRRVAALALSNEELRCEIARRQVVEESLKQSEQHLNRLLEQSRLMALQLRQLSRQVLHAQEEERKRISRELHDVIAQTLTSISVRLTVLKKEARHKTAGFERSITRTQQLVEQSVDTVHQFARDLRPAVLDDLGLIPALHAHLKSFVARTGIRTNLTAFAGVEQLDPARRTVLFRVAQEALTNIARHSQASQAAVKIQKIKGGICMKIVDDGKGFLPQRVLAGKKVSRLGVLGMRERVEMVGGEFAIESLPGKGTTIHARLPFAGNLARNGKESAVIRKHQALTAAKGNS